ncbi:HYR domain-containing protein [Corallococcus sp. CA054B]|uniref:kelch repeat-containing protein n=1 Tax=Corallococcus sp. CA054B TaxID=2316734 RepID=UPI000EA15416|nr:kelch repeat-containing protein [Corallococcus sp. CA054B]RKG59173.1 HYR domain-containing protein [Corallococcus sp. CA054B]
MFAASLGLLSCGGNERPAAPAGIRTTHARLATAPAWYDTASMATARAQHATVLLPDGRLLVVNGVNSADFVGAAETYDPATNTWSSAGPTSLTGNITLAVLLPTGRVLVLTDGSQGGRLYDPATNAWSGTGNMSSTRSIPTATLLGTGQVLIAGGTGGGGVRLATAELYDPATNTFLPTGAMLQGRNAHTATRLRDGRVLAVSGFSGSGEVAGADLYAPATGTWSAAAPPLVPRHYATSTLLPDGRVLVAGGLTEGGVVTTQSELYDPAANTWTATGSLTFPRNGHMATLLPDGRVLVTGGSASTVAAAQIESEIYDPATGTWTNAGTMNVARENHTATLLPTGKVFVAGGYSRNPGLTYYAQTEVYDPARSQWSPAGAMGTPRTDPAVALLPSGQVLVAGGREVGASSAAVEVYDRASNSWSAAPALDERRERATATVLRSGQVLVAGGRDAGISTESAQRFDPATNTWLATAALPSPRHLHTATLLPDGRVLVVGGQRNTTVLDTVEIYAPDTNTWTSGPALATPRGGHRAVLLQDGRVLVAGGHTGGGAELNSAELYDPASDTWAPAASLLGARDELTLTLLPSGQVLAAGGLAAFTKLTSAEIYTPGTNTWTPVGALTQARWLHSATLMPSGKVLVAGGITTTDDYANTAEVYDPSLRAWTNVEDPAAAGGLITVSLPSGEVLLAGGQEPTNAQLFDDTRALPAWKPAVTNPATLVAACPTVVEGLRFRGISGGSGGNSADSPTDFPLVRLRAAEGGRLWTLPSSNTSDTRATVTVPADAPLGTYALSVFANAIPGGRMVTVVANQPPAAADQTVTIEKDTPLEFALAATDPDPGQVLTWTVVTPPQHGTITTGAQGNPVYTPEAGFVGTDSFTYRVRDCANDSNVATVTLDVTEDVVTRTLTCPANVVAEATGPDGAVVTYDPAVLDPAGGLPVSYTQPSGTQFPIGTTTVTATSTGLTCSFQVTVQDTTAPTLTCPESRSAAPGETVTFEPTATDAVTASPVVTSSPASGTALPAGATTVTVTATDDAGNTAQCTFQVRVQAQVVEIAGGGCDSSGGTTSALALLAALAAWGNSRRRQNPARGN